MRQWYRNTHSVSPLASAQDMCAILEAYWNLSSKRFIDNVCMVVDREILGKLSSSMQEQMFRFVRDDSKLESFFTEDPLLIQKRETLESRRDRLNQASTALSRIQIRPTSLPPTPPITPVKTNTITPSSIAGAGTKANAGSVNRLVLTVTIGTHGIGLGKPLSIPFVLYPSHVHPPELFFSLRSHLTHPQYYSLMPSNTCHVCVCISIQWSRMTKLAV